MSNEKKAPIRITLAQQNAVKGKPVLVSPGLICTIEQVNASAESVQALRVHLARVAERAYEEGLCPQFALHREALRLQAEERNRKLLQERKMRKRLHEVPMQAAIEAHVQAKRGTKAAVTAGKGIATPSRPRRVVVQFRRVLENGQALIASWSRSSQTMLAAVQEFCCDRYEWHRGHQRRLARELQAALSL